jgi:hypothetical protein
MKLPADVYFRSDLGLLLWKPRGLLNEKVVNTIIDFIRDEEAKSDANEFRYIDTSDLTAVDLNFRYVFHVALYRRMSRRGQSPIKSAFLVRNLGFAHYFKLHALLTDHSPLQVKLFDRPEAAAEWLGLPVERLRGP